MVIYNPKDWKKLIFAFHKSDTFRMMLPGILGVAAFTGIVAYLENDYFNASFKNTTAIHSLVGFVLSLLLVFRTNTAYDRWWEGRKQWGAMVNNSRNLALKLSVIIKSEEVKKRFRIHLINYVFAIKEHLRTGVVWEEITATESYSHKELKEVIHVPNRIMKAIYGEVQQLIEKKEISHEQMLFINEELRSFTDIVGACERIKKTPIPYSYGLFINKVIFIYVFTMPIGFVREFGYWAMPIVSLVFYVFGSIELIAEEIEDPFGRDANDLPIDTIAQTIKDNLNEIL
jgi:putative membrane protein